MNGSTELRSSLSNYDETERSSIVADRQLLEELFANLFENRVIYHERITILSEVERVEITDSELDVTEANMHFLAPNDRS